MTFDATHLPKILGTATLNDKGQLVIPVEARHNLDMNPGDKVVIMQSPRHPALVIIKAEEVESMIQGLTDVLRSDVVGKLRADLDMDGIKES